MAAAPELLECSKGSGCCIRMMMMLLQEKVMMSMNRFEEDLWRWLDGVFYEIKAPSP